LQGTREELIEHLAQAIEGDMLECVAVRAHTFGWHA